MPNTAVLYAMMPKDMQERVLGECAVNSDETREKDAGILCCRTKAQIENIAKSRRQMSGPKAMEVDAVAVRGHGWSDDRERGPPEYFHGPTQETDEESENGYAYVQSIGKGGKKSGKGSRGIAICAWSSVILRGSASGRARVMAGVEPQGMSISSSLLGRTPSMPRGIAGTPRRTPRGTGTTPKGTASTPRGTATTRRVIRATKSVQGRAISSQRHASGAERWTTSCEIAQGIRRGSGPSRMIAARRSCGSGRWRRRPTRSTLGNIIFGMSSSGISRGRRVGVRPEGGARPGRMQNAVRAENLFNVFEVEEDEGRESGQEVVFTGSVATTRKPWLNIARGGGGMQHYGQKEVLFECGGEGISGPQGLAFQATDVRKPLLSVRRLGGAREPGHVGGG